MCCRKEMILHGARVKEIPLSFDPANLECLLPNLSCSTVRSWGVRERPSVRVSNFILSKKNVDTNFSKHINMRIRMQPATILTVKTATARYTLLEIAKPLIACASEHDSSFTTPQRQGQPTFSGKARSLLSRACVCDIVCVG